MGPRRRWGGAAGGGAGMTTSPFDIGPQLSPRTEALFSGVCRLRPRRRRCLATRPRTSASDLAPQRYAPPANLAWAIMNRTGRRPWTLRIPSLCADRLDRRRGPLPTAAPGPYRARPCPRAAGGPRTAVARSSSPPTAQRQPHPADRERRVLLGCHVLRVASICCIQPRSRSGLFTSLRLRKNFLMRRDQKDEVVQGLLVQHR